MDHVSAFNAINSKLNAKNETSSRTKRNPVQYAKEVFINTHQSKVEKSKKFRVAKIIETLQDHFKKCWEHQKSVSSKLSFYHSIKKKLS